MGYVELYKGRKSPHNVAAHHEDTRRALKLTAEQIGLDAQAILNFHHGQTQTRFHNDPPPRIVVQQGSLDWYVLLDAGSEARAVGIEFGHRYEGRDKNASGPWGQSGGLNVLGRAVQLRSLFGDP